MHLPSLLIINFIVYVCYCPYNSSFIVYNDINSCISGHIALSCLLFGILQMAIHVQSCTVHFTQCYQLGIVIIIIIIEGLRAIVG